MTEKSHNFPEGVLGRDQELTIVVNYWDRGPYRCRHALEVLPGDLGYRRPSHLDPGEEDLALDQFITPAVVQAMNQGGYDCTVTCLDCITEAAGQVRACVPDSSAWQDRRPSW